MDGTVEEPSMYLGADIIKIQIPESEDPEKVRWSMVSTTYTSKAISDVERVLGRFLFFTKWCYYSCCCWIHRPEIDPNPELNQMKQNYY